MVASPSSIPGSTRCSPKALEIVEHGEGPIIFAAEPVGRHQFWAVIPQQKQTFRERTDVSRPAEAAAATRERPIDNRTGNQETAN